MVKITRAPFGVRFLYHTKGGKMTYLKIDRFTGLQGIDRSSQNRQGKRYGYDL